MEEQGLAEYSDFIKRNRKLLQSKFYSATVADILYNDNFLVQREVERLTMAGTRKKLKGTVPKKVAKK